MAVESDQDSFPLLKLHVAADEEAWKWKAKVGRVSWAFTALEVALPEGAARRQVYALKHRVAAELAAILISNCMAVESDQDSFPLLKLHVVADEETWKWKAKAGRVSWALTALEVALPEDAARQVYALKHRVAAELAAIIERQATIRMFADH